jgi:uncharacterized ferritin-like protein (DUF455 family)
MPNLAPNLTIQNALSLLRETLEQLLRALRLRLIEVEATRTKISIGGSIFLTSECLRRIADVSQAPTADTALPVERHAAVPGEVLCVTHRLEPLLTLLRTTLPDIVFFARSCFESAVLTLEPSALTASPFITGGALQLSAEVGKRRVQAVAHPGREQGVPAPPNKRHQALHDGIFRIELCAAEVCAAIALRFPDLPPELDQLLALQSVEELRHARLLSDALEADGGTLGSHPIDTKIWDNNLQASTLAEALFIQHFLGEGYALGHDLAEVDRHRAEGRQIWADIYASLYQDELEHVRQGVAWARKLATEPTEALIARFEQRVAATPPEEPHFSGETRRKIGFLPNEIARQRAFRDKQ